MYAAVECRLTGRRRSVGTTCNAMSPRGGRTGGRSRPPFCPAGTQEPRRRQASTRRETSDRTRTVHLSATATSDRSSVRRSVDLPILGRILSDRVRLVRNSSAKRSTCSERQLSSRRSVVTWSCTRQDPNDRIVGSRCVHINVPQAECHSYNIGRCFTGKMRSKRAVMQWQRWPTYVCMYVCM